MSAVACPEADVTRRRLRQRAEDLLPAAENALLVAHVAACRSCRETALSEDPTFLFSVLSASAEAASASSPRARASEEADVRRLTADVRAVLEVERSRRRLAARRNAVLRRAAALAGLAAGVAALLLARGGPPGPAAPAATAPEAVAAAPAAAPSTAPERRALPLVEAVESRQAQVFEFAADTPDDPTVVFVVDQSVDL